MIKINSAFTDPSVMPIADAIARGEIQQIHKLANASLLQQRGDQLITLTQWAILSQQPTSLVALMQEHADPTQSGMQGNTAWHTAASVQDASYMRILLDSGVPPNIRNSVTLAVPLASAVMAGREIQVSSLLAAGVDPNLADRMGDTPLHVAGKINAPNLALRLLNAGADPTLRNTQGATFQQYLAMMPSEIQSIEMKEELQKLNHWLRDNNFAQVDGK